MGADNEIVKSKRFTEKQVIGVLRKAEAGAKTKDLCRRYGIWDVIFYIMESEIRRARAVSTSGFWATLSVPERY